MKVTGTGGPSATTGARATRSGDGFSLGQAGGAAAPVAASAVGAPSSVADVSALMALQEIEGPLEKRRRAVRRGGGLLDRLDELKMALLSGESGGPALERLARVLREERPDDGDVELNALLDQIDLRAQVELAKAEPRGDVG